MESHIVKEVMNLGHCLHCVKTVELEVASIEVLREVAIAREVFLLDLELRWPAAAVVHVVGTVNRRAYVQSMLWIL